MKNTVRINWCVLGFALAALASSALSAADTEQVEPLAAMLATLDTRVLPADGQNDPRDMLYRDFRARIAAANARSSAEWNAIDSLPKWEAFRDQRLEALRRSLGAFPAQAPTVESHVTRTLAGDGFRIDNLVFNSRPGIWITANLYRPDPPADSMPGIVICHSHHAPKTHGELQDMGMTWARAGCLVLVMDQVGHGERREHGFHRAADYSGEFRVSRQDYYFRYDLGIQLHLAGQSLVGQIAWDLRRGVDLLLAHPGIDPQRMILLGAVAGGGDPAAVAAAIDERFTAAVPFNFGGPQPETRYPLPEDVETSFNYAGSGSWESTRNLYRSAGDGFLPWVIVGSIAPRRLVFAHEFNWDQPRDPVWKRLQKIYAWYGEPDHLAYTHGRGELRGSPPEATHCTHIGAFHRQRIHTALAGWFGIQANAETEYSDRRPAEELLCMTPDLRARLAVRPLHEVLANEFDAGHRDRIRSGPLDDAATTRTAMQNAWRRYGCDPPEGVPRVIHRGEPEALGEFARVERITLEVEPQIVVPLLWVHPAADADAPRAAVVAIAQDGKQAFLERRAEQLARLIEAGLAVCLPDVRGTGETAPGTARDRRSSATSLSSSELMLGGTHVGARVRDLHSVLAYLRSRGDVDGARIGLWGDSFVAPNPADTDVRVPHDVDGRPQQVEPLGGLLALLGGLGDDRIAAVWVRGGLGSYRSVLESPFVYLPHDAVVPGVLSAGDLPDVAAALAPRPLRIDELVDGLNRPMNDEAARDTCRVVLAAYRQAGGAEQIHVHDSRSSGVAWLVDKLR